MNYWGDFKTSRVCVSQNPALLLSQKTQEGIMKRQSQGGRKCWETACLYDFPKSLKLKWATQIWSRYFPSYVFCFNSPNEIPFNFSSSFKGLLLCEAAQHKTKSKVYMSWCQGANLSPIYFLSLPLLENIHRSTRNLVCNCSRAKLNLNSKEVAVYGTYRLSSSAEMLPISAYLCTFRDSLKVSGYILHDIRWNL